MITARHSGKCGDILYSLPAAKALGVEILYIPENTDQCTGLYSNMRGLLTQQPWLKGVREYPSLGGTFGKMIKDPNIHIDYDLDRHFEHPARGKVNMVKRYFDIFDIKGIDHRVPWLTVEGPRPVDHGYHLINLTPRFRDNSRVNWKRVYERIEKPVYFIGTVEEHEEFVEKIGYISRLETKDFLTFAVVIKYCSALYCNQSSSLPVAQSLSIPYHCEFKPGKSNCKFYTSLEHELL